MELSAESVLALAPDAASAKAANGLLKPGIWPTLGANAAAVWGECQGSGSKPYQTQVDLSGPTFKCACPSRKFPCKHGLALLLLRAKDASLFTATTPPAWVAEWLGARTERAQKKDDQQREKALAPPPDPSVALKSTQQRWKRIDAGVAELQQWLLDQMARGLGSLGPGSRAAWQSMAARMVDAKAPGLGQRLNNAAAGLMQGADWPKNTLRQLGLLQLACEAVTRRAALSEPASADLRVTLGWPLDKDAVLAQPDAVQDEWQVIGTIQEERDNNLQERRVWLHGLRSGRRALLLEHSFAGKGFELAWLAQSRHEAALAFYPSAAPLRALVVNSQSAEAASAAPVSAACADASPEQEWRAIAQRVASNPWIALHPLRCHQATPCREADGFRLHWGGQSLPLTLGESDSWALLALSGGQPLSLMGEWNGEALRPLTATGPDGVWNRSFS